MRYLRGSLIVLLLACGSVRGGAPCPLTASFAPSGTPQAPDLVYVAPGATQADRIVVDVMIAGPTSSNDIYSFSFDLELDPARVEFVSATTGPALDPAGCSGVQTFAAPLNGRVVIGVTKTGGCPGSSELYRPWRCSHSE